MAAGMTGFIAYEGPSRFDGAPIALVVTLASHNSKTGNMAQAWVIRTDATPNDAIADGRDRSICGTCVHRSGGVIGRSCFVVWWQGPTAVYKSLHAGHYRALDPPTAAEQLADRHVRVTAYGDPAAVRIEIWRALLARSAGWTGYSHAWRTADQRFRELLMASVESDREADEAHALGWRTFRTRLASEPVRADEIVCPASDEAGHATQCERCGLCAGGRRAGARSITIIAHGQRVRWLADKKALAS